MLSNSQQREPALHDPHRQPPALFGKPWFWQRSSDSMEGTRSLARVIMEMREEIRKLDAQKRALPKDQGDQEQEQTPEVFLEEEQENSIRRNASAPILKRQFEECKDNTVMTVRRYSMNSSPPGVTQSEGTADLAGRLSHFGWGRVQEEVCDGNCDIDHSVSSDPARKKTSLQEYVHKTRAKAKTVTFLLPVDDIYTNKSVLPKPQDATPTELAPVTDLEYCTLTST
ncbi:uncharacterized protein LOC133505055 [Syngnathoides biaculeatus]|uniref:uncharacterized protein LOC133505055 n=1 Tax=Syngnathoides biaculeatus TaxID=300417 RepID=UPI002ADDAD1A|nr:uncharacterized protein LOC133505055 [Syngnathoides biaculeatus]XP_061683915.1 uncharacterized protein LOC133505055 [Syngnathoides biaculeatus]